MNCEVCNSKLESRINVCGNKVMNKRFCSNKCYHAWITKGKNAQVLSRLNYSGRKVTIEKALNEIEKNNKHLSNERHSVKIVEPRTEQIILLKELLEKQLTICKQLKAKQTIVPAGFCCSGIQIPIES